MARKTDKDKMPETSVEDLGVLALASLNARAQIAQLKKQQEEYDTKLKAAVEANGIETPKEHKILEVEHAGRKIELKMEKRVGTEQIPDAVDTLKVRLSKATFAKVTEKITIFREDVFEVLHQQGEISDEIVEEIYTTKESFAFKIKALN